MSIFRKAPPIFDGKLTDFAKLSDIDVLRGCCAQGGCCRVPEEEPEPEFDAAIPKLNPRP